MWYNAGSYFSGKDIFILKAIGRVISSAILLVLTGLMVAFAKAAPNVVFSFYPALSKSILSAIASVSSLVPIALWEVLTVLLALWFFYTLIRVFTGHRSLLRWLSGVLLGLSTGVFLFVAIWGLGHFGPPVDKSLGLDVREYSKQELIARNSLLRCAGKRICRKSRTKRGKSDCLSGVFHTFQAGPRRLHGTCAAV